MSEERKLSVFKKHDKNPFIEKAIDEINGQIVKQYKTATGMDKRAVLMAMDPKTGEALGHTTFIRQVEVDEDKFAKLYLSQFAVFWELGKQAIRVFGYIMTKMVKGQDTVLFFMHECLQYTGYGSKKPIYQGLADLVKAEIIARTEYDNIYFINPLVVFNGNRVTFAKSYLKKQKEDPNQIKLFGEPTTEVSVEGKAD